MQDGHGPGAANAAETWRHLVLDRMIEHGAAASHARICATGGDGPAVAILPSLGRGVADYTEAGGSVLATRLAEAGFRVVLIDPRGAGRSRGDLRPERCSMALLAGDLKDTLDALGLSRLHLVGHAFGNRLARVFATQHPGMVETVTLLAAGGNFAMGDAQMTAMRACFDPDATEAARRAAIARAFFAAGNDPAPWFGGWYPELLRAQAMAARMADGGFYKAAGGRPILLLQGAEDRIAPPDLAGRPLATELGAQVRYVEIAGAGHAMVCERAEAIAAEIVAYLRGG